MEREDAAVGLLRIALQELGGQRLEALGVPALDRGDAAAGPVRRSDRDTRSASVTRSSSRCRERSRMKVERVDGHGGRDVRVAVAVAADPRAEGQSSGGTARPRRGRRRRPRPRVAVGAPARRRPGWKTTRPPRTSSSTVERPARSSSGPQLLHGGQQPAAACASAPGTAARSSRSRRAPKTRASFSGVVRRRASVGWAVRTRRTSARASRAASSWAVVPSSRRRSTASRNGPARGAGASRASAPARGARARCPPPGS